MNFKICDDVSALGIRVGFLAINDLDNHHDDKLLKNKIDKFYADFLENYTPKDLENDANIIGYRKLHESIFITDKSLVASPESLIKILFKYKYLKPINYIVNTYNYVAIKNRISIGAHDMEYICGNVRLCFTNGDERFIPLGKKTPQSINRNEYCYMDDANDIICRLDCRQCDKTKITENTNSCLFIIQGHVRIANKELESTAKELLTLFQSNRSHTTENNLTIL